MQKRYKIQGMTCTGCVAAVTQKLLELNNVSAVDVQLKSQEAIVTTSGPVALELMRSTLPEKYTITEKGNAEQGLPSSRVSEKSKLRQLRPLLLIFIYLFGASLLLHYKDWDTKEAMLDFMGLFFIVFSFFKLLDLPGFSNSFRMYDPLAKAFPMYGKIYPFVELILGLFFMLRFQLPLALVLTFCVLGITTIGVTKTLLNKKSIQCACLGTALKLPMTEATFIENAIMLLMSLAMLGKIV